MKTKVVDFKNENLIDAILSNKVVAFPTETVFGLGIRYSKKEAFDNLVSLKRRKPDKPFTVMISRKEDIYKFAYVSDRAKRIIEHFMPGEITIILPVKENVFPWVSLGYKTVGIRIPNKIEVIELIKKVGEPMLVTSANMSGEPPLTNSFDVKKIFNDKIEYIVEGVCDSNVPSTIVLIDENDIKLIREGSISFNDIQEEWGK